MGLFHYQSVAGRGAGTFSPAVENSPKFALSAAPYWDESQGTVLTQTRLPDKMNYHKVVYTHTGDHAQPVTSYTFHGS
jgi:hypothetical protein